MFREILKDRLAGICDLQSKQIDLLEQHYELLIRWNRVVNLTALRDLEEIVERHYCESLFLATHLPSEPVKIADVGSGAGFPGVPVAVLLPASSVTLIEPHQRKAVFLRESTRELPNVRVSVLRVEKMEAQFDWVVSRAVKVAEITEWLKKFAHNAALLAGDSDLSGTGDLKWAAPIRLPWAARRFLWIGSHT